GCRSWVLALTSDLGPNSGPQPISRGSGRDRELVAGVEREALAVRGVANPRVLFTLSQIDLPGRVRQAFFPRRAPFDPVSNQFRRETAFDQPPFSPRVRSHLFRQLPVFVSQKGRIEKDATIFA